MSRNTGTSRLASYKCNETIVRLGPEWRSEGVVVSGEVALDVQCEGFGL
jgi:hypothetical protein